MVKAYMESKTIHLIYTTKTYKSAPVQIVNTEFI